MFFNFSLISFPKHSYSLSFFTPTLYQELAAFLHHRGDFHRQRKSHWSDHWMFRIHAGHTWRFWCFHFGRWRCFWASFEKFFDEIAQANYKWELTEEQGKYFERYLRLTSRQKNSKQISYPYLRTPVHKVCHRFQIIWVLQLVRVTYLTQNFIPFTWSHVDRCTSVFHGTPISAATIHMHTDR